MPCRLPVDLALTVMCQNPRSYSSLPLIAEVFCLTRKKYSGLRCRYFWRHQTNCEDRLRALCMACVLTHFFVFLTVSRHSNLRSRFIAVYRHMRTPRVWLTYHNSHERGYRGFCLAVVPEPRTPSFPHAYWYCVGRLFKTIFSVDVSF